MLVFILVFSGFLTVKYKFFQIRKIGFILKKTSEMLLDKKNNNNKNEISQKGAFCSVLAATMGTGNIIGVVSALYIGGPGAIFWMWISAFSGMMIVYAENYFGTLYRKKDCSGKWCGGALCYIEKAAGKYIAYLYAFFCIFASFGMGNMVQSNSIASAAEKWCPASITGAVTALICAMVIIGGIKRISSFTEILIPLISVIYIISVLIIIVYNIEKIPIVFSKIFSGAFGLKALGGGVSGEIIKKSISTGMKRGVFSNESGLGTSSMFHSQCSGYDPEIQGITGMAEVFFDTIVCCTLTALAVLCSESNYKNENLNSTIVYTFYECFGKYSNIFVCLSICLFAFATLIGWSHCGERAFSMIFGEKYSCIYRFIYCLLSYIGAVTSLNTVWTLSDIFNGLMIIPNISSLIILCKKNKMNMP